MAEKVDIYVTHIDDEPFYIRPITVSELEICTEGHHRGLMNAYIVFYGLLSGHKEIAKWQIDKLAEEIMEISQENPS